MSPQTGTFPTSPRHRVSGRVRYVADERNATRRNEMLIVRAAAAAAAGVVLVVSGAMTSATRSSVTECQIRRAPK